MILRVGPALVLSVVLPAFEARAAEARHPRLVRVEATRCETCHRDVLPAGTPGTRRLTPACVACHTVTTGEVTRVGTRPEPALCLECHRDLGARAKGRAKHTPLPASCAGCHPPHASLESHLQAAAPAPAPRASVAAPSQPAPSATASATHAVPRATAAPASPPAPTASAPPEAARPYTLSLFVACSEGTLQRARAKVKDERFFSLPVVHDGKDCAVLCWGRYPSREEAEAARETVPRYFLDGGAKPAVAPLTRFAR